MWWHDFSSIMWLLLHHHHHVFFINRYSSPSPPPNSFCFMSSPWPFFSTLMAVAPLPLLGFLLSFYLLLFQLSDPLGMIPAHSTITPSIMHLLTTTYLNQYFLPHLLHLQNAVGLSSPSWHPMLLPAMWHPNVSSLLSIAIMFFFIQQTRFYLFLFTFDPDPLSTSFDALCAMGCYLQWDYDLIPSGKVSEWQQRTRQW